MESSPTQTQTQTRSSFIDGMNHDEKRRRTENGAPEVSHKGLDSPLLALFEKLVRDVSDDRLVALFAAAVERIDESAFKDLVVLVFQTRATRGMGKGEKLLFYKMLLMLPKHVLFAVLPLLPHYGYWKDYYLLLQQSSKSKLPSHSELTSRCFDLIIAQLRDDERELEAATKEERSPTLSLCGKFMPTENGSIDRKLGLSKLLAKKMFGVGNDDKANRKYRLLRTKLNAALRTTEVLMASGRYAAVVPREVPAMCMQRHRKAFLNEKLKTPPTFSDAETGNRFPTDPDRVACRKNVIATIKAPKGLKGGQLYPHTIVSQSFYTHDKSEAELEVANSQWKDLVASLNLEGVQKLVPLVDVSGSMQGEPMNVAIALGLIVAKVNHPAFRGHVLTFETCPQWFSVDTDAPIHEQVQRCALAPWGGSTNFEAAIDRILETVTKHNLSEEDVPDMIVFSDMQFDEANRVEYSWDAPIDQRQVVSGWETHHERIVRRFARAGMKISGKPYKPPRIIFWNLRGDTNEKNSSMGGFPVEKSAVGTVMLSGFSPALLKHVLNGEQIKEETPEDVLCRVIADEAFDRVRTALEGVSWTPPALHAEEKEEAVEEEAMGEAKEEATGGDAKGEENGEENGEGKDEEVDVA